MREIRNGKWHRILICLVAWQLAVASLVPQGYMLDVLGGQNTIVVCTADGLVTIPDPTQPEDEKAGQTLCSFSSNAQPLLASNADALSSDRPVESGVVPGPVTGDFATRRHTPAQPRAPPTA